MARVFTREHLLNVTVNVIPLGIILFFTVFFLVFSPWEFAALPVGLLVLLHAVPFVLLAILTYFAARAIEVEPGETDEEGIELGEESGVHAGEAEDE